MCVFTHVHMYAGNSTGILIGAADRRGEVVKFTEDVGMLISEFETVRHVI